jgi:hypothetical protein
MNMTVSEKPLHIDIPVKMTNVRTVYSIGALAFEGDLPASIFHLQLIEGDIADWNAKSDIATGNPYRELVQGLMKRGVQIELCGATAKVYGWGNADLLPGVKVNTDAMARTTQLVQAGFVKITE